MRRRRADRHGRFLELLSLRLLAPLAADEEQELEGHLAGCDRCSIIAAGYRRESRALRGLPRFDPPRDLWARTGVALDREVARGRRPWERPADPYEPPRRDTAAGPAMVAIGVLAIVGALVAGQVLPFALLGGDGSGRAPRPTPFPVPPQELALVGADPQGLAILLASVEQMCPRPIEDCVDARADRRVLRASVLRSPSAVAIGPDGDRMAVTGKDLDGGVVYAVLELAPLRPGPATRPEDVEPPATTGSNGSGKGSVETAEATDPDQSILRASPPTGKLPKPDGGLPPTPTEDATGPVPSAEVTLAPVEGPVQEEAQAILRGVLAAGAPPAWSPDGKLLAFSAMPADHSTGPDIYVWRPGDGDAHRLTDDHRSWFASWAGERIVVSRPVDRSAGAEDVERVVQEAAVIDLATGEERLVHGFRAWLPTVDPLGQWAIAWRGRLEVDGSTGVRPMHGNLVLIDWERIDPFGDAGDGREAIASGRVVGQGSRVIPLRDWQVRWSGDGSAHGVWIADEAGADAGMLTVAATDPPAGAMKQRALVGPVRARRGFSIGHERVAWVAPDPTGTARDFLQVGTWGQTGAGKLRVTELQTSPAVPGFY